MRSRRKFNMRRVKVPQEKPVMTSNGAIIPKRVKVKLNELEKRLKENYATIENMSIDDKYRLSNVVRNYVEEISGYVGPREKIREILEKVKDSYPLSSATMLAMISDVKTEREAVDSIKEIIKSVPELHKKLVSEELTPEETDFVIQQIVKKIEEKHGPVLIRELDKAIHELGAKDVEVRPLKESDPKTPDFWLRKIELEHNPYLKGLEKVEEHYVDAGGEIKDQILYMKSIIEDYKSGEIDEEELEEEIQNLIDNSMELLEGDREKLLRYLYKFDETEGKSLYRIVVKALSMEKMPTNAAVEKEVEAILKENNIDISKLERTNPKKLKKIIHDAYGKGIHIQELVRTIRKKVDRNKFKKVMEKMDQALNERQEPPDSMYL